MVKVNDTISLSNLNNIIFQDDGVHIRPLSPDMTPMIILYGAILIVEFMNLDTIPDKN